MALLTAAAYLPGYRGRAVTGCMVSPLAILACGAALAARKEPVRAYGHLLRADALSAWLLLTIGAVATLACAAGPPHLAAEREAGRLKTPGARRYCALVQAFLGTMAAAVLASNLGVLWVAIEAATVVTGFLVGHRHTRASVEAAWKYVVICSAGIALAFLGTVLIYYAARQAGISEPYALDWPRLVAHADELDPAVTRLDIALVVLGFGAKAAWRRCPPGCPTRTARHPPPSPR